MWSVLELADNWLEEDVSKRTCRLPLVSNWIWVKRKILVSTNLIHKCTSVDWVVAVLADTDSLRVDSTITLDKVDCMIVSSNPFVFSLSLRYCRHALGKTLLKNVTLLLPHFFLRLVLPCVTFCDAKIRWAGIWWHQAWNWVRAEETLPCPTHATRWPKNFLGGMKERDAGFGSEAGLLCPSQSPFDSCRDHLYYWYDTISMATYLPRSSMQSSRSLWFLTLCKGLQHYDVCLRRL